MKTAVLALILSLSTLSFAAPTQFIAIGDTGRDNDGQRLVSAAMLKHCQKEKCDYGMLAGDNIYDAGMSSVDDPILNLVFRKHYEALEFPFFIALGNHDYGKLSNQWERGAYQLQYSKRYPQYYLPHYYYAHEFENFILVVLDTTRLMWAKDMKEQEALMNEAVQRASSGKFLIVLGHHPYLSNGEHGNAGRYEGVGFPSFVSGTDVKKFFDKNVCGKAHLYISGHDHNLQLFDGRTKNCGTLLLVSGGGSSTEGFKNRDKNQTLFAAESLGFTSVLIDKNFINLRLINEQNRVLFQQELRKSRRR